MNNPHDTELKPDNNDSTADDISIVDCLYNLDDNNEIAGNTVTAVDFKKRLNPLSSLQKRILYVSLLLCICVFLFALFNIGRDIYLNRMQRELDMHINELFDAAAKRDFDYLPVMPGTGAGNTDAQPADSDNPDKNDTDNERSLLEDAEKRGRIIFADLLEINPDFLGMIEIPGVIERQPYVMSKDNAEYLSRNFQGQRTGMGTIFLNAASDRLLTDNNSTFFGHYNAKNNGMFTRLTEYKKPETFAVSPVVILDGLIGESVWIIFAVHIVEADKRWMESYNDADDYAQHLEIIQSRSMFYTDVDVTADDRIITLSVCDYTLDDSRLLVHARKLRPGEEIPGKVTAQKEPFGLG